MDRLYYGKTIIYKFKFFSEIYVIDNIIVKLALESEKSKVHLGKYSGPR